MKQQVHLVAGKSPGRSPHRAGAPQQLWLMVGKAKRGVGEFGPSIWSGLHLR